VQSDTLNPMDYVECNDCGAMCDLQQDEPAAIAAWNLRASGWQPISTAPRDGTRVLCYAPAAEDRAAVIRNDYWWMQERGWVSMRPGQPYTHWQPLPAAPDPQEPTP
jgi:hypothetical protein